jgi:hypothetical protein
LPRARYATSTVRLGAAEPASVFDDRNASAAAADDDRAAFDEELDRFQLDDPAGLRRRNDPPEVGPVARDRPVVLPRELTRFALRIDRADLVG